MKKVLITLFIPDYRTTAIFTEDHVTHVLFQDGRYQTKEEFQLNIAFAGFKKEYEDKLLKVFDDAEAEFKKQLNLI